MAFKTFDDSSGTAAGLRPLYEGAVKEATVRFKEIERSSSISERSERSTKNHESDSRRDKRDRSE
jgi:hypothetical protein